MIGSPELTRAIRVAVRALQKAQEIAEKDGIAIPTIRHHCGGMATNFILGGPDTTFEAWIEGTEYIE